MSKKDQCYSGSGNMGLRREATSTFMSGSEPATAQSYGGSSLSGSPGWKQWRIFAEFYPKAPFSFHKSNEDVELDDLFVPVLKS